MNSKEELERRTKLHQNVDMFLVDPLFSLWHFTFGSLSFLFGLQPPRPEISMVLVTAVYTSRVGSECWDPLGLPDGTTIVTRYWPCCLIGVV